jgi:hypothetical protein
MSKKGKLGGRPKEGSYFIKGVLDEKDLALAGGSGGDGHAVRAGRHGAVLRGRHGHLHSYGYRYSHCYVHRYSHCYVHRYFHGNRDRYCHGYCYGYRHRTAQERRTAAGWVGYLGGQPGAHGLRRWSACAAAA